MLILIGTRIRDNVLLAIYTSSAFFIFVLIKHIGIKHDDTVRIESLLIGIMDVKYKVIIISEIIIPSSAI